MFNLLVQVLVGLPLEMVHGSLRIGTVYMAGVLAGEYDVVDDDDDHHPQRHHSAAVLSFRSDFPSFSPVPVLTRRTLP